MNKRQSKDLPTVNVLIYAILACTLISVPYIYFIGFTGGEINFSSPSTWINFATFFGNMATPILTLGAVALAFSQLRHQKFETYQRQVKEAREREEQERRANREKTQKIEQMELDKKKADIQHQKEIKANEAAYREALKKVNLKFLMLDLRSIKESNALCRSYIKTIEKIRAESKTQGIGNTDSIFILAYVTTTKRLVVDCINKIDKVFSDDGATGDLIQPLSTELKICHQTYQILVYELTKILESISPERTKVANDIQNAIDELTIIEDALKNSVIYNARKVTSTKNTE